MLEGVSPAQVERLGPWFHNIELPGGIETAPDHPLGDFPRCNWEAFALRIPRDLTGWRVLDVGCNAGFYSFQLARRGADVVGIDIDERYLRQARWAAELLGHDGKVRFERRQVYDLSDGDGVFDLVLFLGVFYHLRYPLLGLDIVRERTRRLMVFQTLTTPGRHDSPPTHDRDITALAALDDPGWPSMSFVEGELAGDPTNWWVPNGTGVQALLRSSGFDVVDAGGAPFYVCAPAAAEPAHRSWNRSEFLAARGAQWRDEAAVKLAPRTGTLERPRRP